jgi:spermidine/putrescine transport system substrate-binding protein
MMKSTSGTTLNGGAIGRRSAMKAALAVGAGVLASPAIVRQALSSSGQLNFMGWAGYDFKPAFADFTKTTGIKMNFTEQPEQDTFTAQAKATKGQGLYDICEPTADRVQNWLEQDFVQPWNEKNIALDTVEPGLLQGAAASLELVDGKRYLTPSCWGTEAITFNTQEAAQTYGQCSLSVLWDPKYEGKVTVRPHSGLAALGRWLETQGKLPHPFNDSYKDEKMMRANWDIILQNSKQLKKNVGQFWKDENTAQGAFRSNGCVIGQTWDSSAFQLKQDGVPVSYLAPKEGAFAWMQGIILFKDAKNVEQAEAFIRWLNTPKGSAAWGAAFTANPCGKGAINLLPQPVKDQYNAAFPGDALSKLWWWPSQPTWYLGVRNEYADKFQAS